MIQHTPPPSSDDSRNIILALILTALVVIGWQWFFPSAAPQQQVPDQPVAPTVTQAKKAPAPVQTRETILAEATRIRIDTPRLHGSIDTRGLRLNDLTLATYQETIDPDSPEVTLLTPRTEGEGYYMELGWAGKEGDLPNKDTIWTASHNTLTPEQPVTFHWVNAQNIRFEQIMEVDKHYMFTVKQRVINQSDKAVTFAPYSLTNRTLNEEEQAYLIMHEGPLGADMERLYEYGYDELRDGNITRKQQHGWAGITDKYWLTAMIPEMPGFTTTYQYYQQADDARYQVDVLGTPYTVTPSGTAQTVTRLFAGAKEMDLLDSYGERHNIVMFDRAVDFGILYFLTRPMFEALQYMHGVMGNFGLAILALTVCIKLVMFPLANKSYGSMSQMKLLMPKMQEIRERHGDDRIKMNQEIMEMYKREGVNPASGCLPLLIQIPVFFALYKVLFITIEMRHAPFYGWIEDLSVKDPTNIFTLFGAIPWDPPSFLHVGLWPLIMTITMVIQQRLNPKPADPTQAQVMQILPYMFLFLFASFPAGLVIYWAWNNTLSIIQQYVITRRYKKIYDKETGKRIKSRKRS